MTSLTTVEKVPYVIIESHQNRINYLPEETTVCLYRFHYDKSMIRSFAMNEKFELIHRVGRYYPRIMQINMARFCISTFWHSCKCLNISNCSLQETCMSRNLNIKTRKDTLSKRISALENVRYQRLTQWQLQ